MIIEDPVLFVVFAGVLALLIFGASSRRKKTESTRGGASVYTSDLTLAAEEGRIERVTGRDEEIERVTHILLRRTKNNPLLIGQPGVGKTAIVEGLADRIAKKNVPPALQTKRVLVLDLPALVSQTQYRGELEARLKNLLEELRSFSGNAILFIDEIHLLEQIGRSEGALSISDAIKPELARGDIQVIGATTWVEYERYIKPDQALDRRFQPVLVDEPTREHAMSMLKGLRSTYEEFHKVKITDAALEAAVRLSDEKITERYLPDKAIDLIDEASAKVSIEASRSCMLAAGVLHAASKEKDDVVDTEDIEEIVDQWVIHSNEDAKRDARQEEIHN